jgi:hypothetical protein
MIDISTRQTQKDDCKDRRGNGSQGQEQFQHCNVASRAALGEKCIDPPFADHLQMLNAIPEADDKRMRGDLLGMQIVREI